MYKSNPNPNPQDLGKVAKSGFKSKSGFGFARHWMARCYKRADETHLPPNLDHTVQIVWGASFITVSCLHLYTNSTAFSHKLKSFCFLPLSGERRPHHVKIETKFDLTQFEDKAPSTTCTVSVLSVILEKIPSFDCVSKSAAITSMGKQMIFTDGAMDCSLDKSTDQFIIKRLPYRK